MARVGAVARDFVYLSGKIRFEIREVEKNAEQENAAPAMETPARFNAAINKFEAGAVPARQIYHLLYKDLVGDTMGTLEAMYRHFGIDLSAPVRH